jgi:hypothetical protein
MIAACPILMNIIGWALIGAGVWLLKDGEWGGAVLLVILGIGFLTGFKGMT